jgi:hypothetical protein
MRFAAVALLASCTFTYPVRTSPPHVRFLDVESGPNGGGENGDGTILTIYGDRFGETQGRSRVTIGGAEVARYLRWSDSEISVAIGGAARSGPVIVDTFWGASNVDDEFTVRSGQIRCVSTDGSDGGSGSWGGCWRTVGYAIANAEPGDIVYVRDGVSENEMIYVDDAGTEELPIAIVGYPGESARIGRVEVRNIDIDPTGLTLAGLRIEGDDAAISASGSDWRLVDNEIVCTEVVSTAVGEGCVSFDDFDTIAMLGNEIHSIALAGAETSTAVAVSFFSNVRGVELGWNRFHDNDACGSIRISGDGATPPHTFSIHHNRFTDERGVGIAIVDVDLESGPFDIVGNLFTRVGARPGATSCSVSSLPEASCIAAQCASGDSVRVAFNTFVSCGAGATRAAISGCDSRAMVSLEDNVFSQEPGDFYVAESAMVAGRTNLWHGAGTGPASCEDNVDVATSPFVSREDDDFHLSPESGAIDRASSAPPARDLEGVARGEPADLGAFER